MERLSLLLTAVWLHLPVPEFASKARICQGAGLGGQGSTNDNPSCQRGLTSRLREGAADITNTLLIVAGAVAVIVIIVAGIRYITSTGDASRIKQSKDTLLFAVIGLVIVILSYAIVRFVTRGLS